MVSTRMRVLLVASILCMIVTFGALGWIAARVYDSWVAGALVVAALTVAVALPTWMRLRRARK